MTFAAILLRLGFGPGAVDLIKRLLPWIVAALLVLFAYLWAYDRGRAAQKAADADQVASLTAKLAKTDAAFAQTTANVRAATAAIEIADAEHKRTVEALQNSITKEKADALERQLADARALAARRAQQLRAAEGRADPGGSAGAPAGGPADAASGAARGSETAELDDAACAEAVVKVRGWQDWYAAQVAVKR